MAHYFDKEPASALREQEVTVHAFGQSYRFLSASGLFSKDHLDTASSLLLERCDLAGAKRVLDLGCGWGAVAVLLKLAHPRLSVVASDVNTRAVLYTKKNAKRHGVEVEVVRSDLFASLSDETFDLILTNPPYVAGRETCFAFIQESFAHLAPGGSLQLVARHNKGGKVLSEYMKTVFGNMEAIAKQGGFRIYKSLRG